MEGKIAGTNISSPVRNIAESKGYTRLGDTTTTFRSVSRPRSALRAVPWAKQNGDKLVPFIRSYVAANGLAVQPANKDEAVSIYVKNLPGAPRPAAEKAMK